jgi:O-succinylbenzoic acid--CoA ligase
MERAELSDRLSARRPRIRSHRPVVVCERDPVRFQAAFAAGVAGAGLVFLADPAWGAAERAQFRALVARAPDRPAPARGWLCIPTGGSSGALRLARHDGETLAAAVGGFSRHFDCPVVSTCGILPLHHVSGLMGWLRVVLTDGRFVSARWTEVESGALPAVPDGDGFVSVVPTQLQRLLARAGTRAWLRRFRAVFVGGGPAWPQLLDDAARAKVPLSLSYGMTETAAMVAALRPEEFAAGDRSCGRPLPHVRVRTRHDGTVTVAGASLFRGYYPAWVSRRAPWVTQDVGFFDPSGALHIEGRRDSLIISGGEKVDPFQVESALRATGEFADVAVLGVPDPEWGASVVACYPMKDASPDWDRVQRRLRRELAAYRRPKRYVGVVDWPRNAQGKLNRATLLRLAQERIARGGFIAG